MAIMTLIRSKYLSGPNSFLPHICFRLDPLYSMTAALKRTNYGVKLLHPLAGVTILAPHLLYIRPAVDIMTPNYAKISQRPKYFFAPHFVLLRLAAFYNSNLKKNKMWGKFTDLLFNHILLFLRPLYITEKNEKISLKSHSGSNNFYPTFVNS